ncbi:hypothetical protein PG990_009130 [Apiospora arundinis]
MGDLETQDQPGGSERTPLLQQHEQYQHQQKKAPLTLVPPHPIEDTHDDASNGPSRAPNEGDEQHEAAALLEPQPHESPRQRTRSWWFWRILWAVLAALVLAVFIKGWIDAKDVEFDVGVP